MCGLFGFIYYGKQGKEPFNLSELAKLLAEHSAVRGTDATGIAYVSKNGKIQIKKKDVDAYTFPISLPKGTRAVMGHTRRTTQGNEKVNRNNHPFPGKIGDCGFALAHNGVLDNDIEIRKLENLPKTKVQTDSYVAVQLLEKYAKLDHEGFRQMAETVEGMFAFTILDENNNIHFIRNDSPLHILHFKSLNLYVYASTQDILMNAVTSYEPTQDAIWENFTLFGDVENIVPSEGDIITIDNGGCVITSKFVPVERWGYNPLYSVAGGSSYWDDSYLGHDDVDDESLYMELIVKEVEKRGYTNEDVENILAYGYELSDIEDAIFGSYLDELMLEVSITSDNDSDKIDYAII